MLKVKARWAGFTGSPGWSNFYFDTGDATFHTPADAVTAADRVNAFFTAIKGRLPAVVNVTVQNDVEVLSTSTGELTNVVAGGTRAAIVGTAAAIQYSGASGSVVTWRTGGVRNGRRVRGRTFLVPCANTAFGTDGTLDPAWISELSTAANALATQSGTIKLGVFSRPSTPGGSDGAWNAVTSATIPDLAAVLRSRRD